MRRAWPVLEPGNPLVDGWALELVCRALERLYRGESNDLLINIPPGFSKSTLVCVLYPAWVWSFDPAHKWICSSYDPKLVLRDAMRTKNLIESPWYQALWPGTAIVRDRRSATDAAGLYYSTAGGYRYSRQIGSGGVGWHCHTHITDDPHKPLDTSLESGIALDRAWEWLGLMGTRAVPGQVHRRIVIMQRLHEIDMAGRILAQEDSSWRSVILPMHYDPDREDCHEDDPRTARGELLNPALKSAVLVDREARAIRDAGADVDAQHEQRPTPPGGKVFKREWIQYWSELPSNVWFLQSWDFTFGERRNSWVVGQLWGTNGESYYLVDQCREQTDYPGMKRMIKDFYRLHPYTMKILVEGAALGKAIIQELAGELRLEEVSVSGKGGKLVRARAVTGMFAHGLVFCPSPDGYSLHGRRKSGAWAVPVVQRLLRFTGAVADIADEVDCCTQALSQGRRAGRFARAMDAARRDR